MKNTVVVIAATGQGHDLTVQPGTTAGDILRQLGLSGYNLTKDQGQYIFGETENIYPEIQDGEKLHAVSKTDVGIST